MDEAVVQREAIARRLRVAREQAGLSQGQVAKLMSWHRPTVSQIEAGQRRVSAEELASLAKHYCVSVSWLAKTGEPDQDQADPQLELAAKELGRLKPDDLQRVIKLLTALKKRGGGHGDHR
ncbi:helix-turn-helix domain-containing protein [Leptolyngbya sp. 7M]|jgi:transcriptional regulator with XRE-family HTH domain|uniref:helix-turn-helix domain-containing protein n=1 Tax=Leptolyngbya sp. 7M TaxID=2812896 RepID=UPI0017AB0649|nr:helix-turn-helix transcriptional regulator [Leptolyngbya sp. 7M]NUQ66908.1 helix-turn-helix transcriptional regulator [Phycisphaerales bacterium]QYO63587.1 helix-turn-helix domain-containing protein [Leptolyngbya sp. 7M]QYU68415.1 helix-turn-helix domain-containing protein [Leptolyngbya sp. 15MV]